MANPAVSRRACCSFTHKLSSDMTVIIALVITSDKTLLSILVKFFYFM